MEIQQGWDGGWLHDLRFGAYIADHVDHDADHVDHHHISDHVPFYEHDAYHVDHHHFSEHVSCYEHDADHVDHHYFSDHVPFYDAGTGGLCRVMDALCPMFGRVRGWDCYPILHDSCPRGLWRPECEAADGDTESEPCNEQACPAEAFDSLAGYLGQISDDAEKERLLFALGTFWSIALEDGQQLVDHTLLDLAATEAGLELDDVIRTVQDMLDASTI